MNHPGLPVSGPSAASENRQVAAHGWGFRHPQGPGVTDSEQVTNVTQLESQPLGALDEPQPVYRAGVVCSVPGRGCGRRRQEPGPFVLADRVWGQPDGVSQLGYPQPPGGDGRGAHGCDGKPWSAVQRQPPLPNGHGDEDLSGDPGQRPVD
jgi:hypothetical protein